MKSIKVCEYSRSRSFHDDLILQDHDSGERSQDQWSSGSVAPELVGYSAPRDPHRRAAYSICESWFLIHQDVYRDLFVCY